MLVHGKKAGFTKDNLFVRLRQAGDWLFVNA